MVSQINTLLTFFIAGTIIGIIFDIFRATRKTFKTPDFVTYIQDIIFWILTGIILLFTIFTFTNGEIRLYMIAFLIFGIFMYYIYISRYFIKVNTKILTFFQSIIKFLIKIIIILVKLPQKILFNAKKLKKFSKSSGK